LSHEFDVIQNGFKELQKKAAVIEKKIGVYHGGYIKRSENLHKQINTLEEQVSNTTLQLSELKASRNNELAAIEQRIGEWTELVSNQALREVKLQQRFAELSLRKKQLEAGQFST
jgi:chaperonin cofactor prefoldin